MPNDPIATPVLPEWLADAVSSLTRGELAGWMALYAPDGVHEFPFAKAGSTRRVEGRDAIGAYLEAVFARIRFGRFDVTHVHEDGEETIVEATGDHHDTAGVPFRIGYVWFITRRNGQVTLMRDYMARLPID